MVQHIDFGKWLEDELLRRKWDQSQLLRYGGLTSGQVSRIISGERKSGPTACLVIAKALGLPPEEVFRKAGLLPPAREPVEGTEELVHYFAQIDPDDRARLLVIARALWEAKDSTKI